MFLTFDVVVFIFTYLDTVQLIDLNASGACVAEKQQSDAKLWKWKQAELNHEGGSRDKWGAVSPPTGEI